MLARLLLVSLFVGSASAAVADTQGTEYRVVFPRNLELSSTNCNLSITVINPNNADVTLMITYYKSLYDYSSQQNERFTVPAGDMFTQFFPKFDAWEYTNGGFQQQFDTRIVITTSQPVNLYANNYQKDGFGDSFLVLPYTLAGTAYSFTLPAPSPLQNGVIQYAIAYIIPTRADVNVEITVGNWNEKRVVPFKIGSNVHYFAVPYSINMKDPSFYITGDKDFLVVAAVSCLPLGSADGKCDYAAFMPTPVVLPGVCSSETATNDNHPSDLTTSRKFSMTPNMPECSSNVVNIYTGEWSDEELVKGAIYTVDNVIGDRAVFALADNSPFSPIRIGGLPGSGGAFLTGLPATTQFVTGTTYFMTRTEKTTLYIITDAVASLTMRLDGQVVNFSPEIIKIQGVQYHFTTAQVTSVNPPSVHKLDASPGKYIFYVTGTQRDGHAYGYYPAFN
ncbi:hypothetical protein PENTCL1PPCAC_25894, partial [Pristionchus entomophagus]